MSDDLLRISEVVRTCAISRATIYRRIRDNSFPPPRVYGAQVRRWPESHVQAWKERGADWRSALPAHEQN